MAIAETQDAKDERQLEGPFKVENINQLSPN
jgi:hypothetical protein